MASILLRENFVGSDNLLPQGRPLLRKLKITNYLE